MDILKIESIKNPIVAFLTGVVMAVTMTWYATSQIMNEQLKANKMLLDQKNEMLNTYSDEMRELKAKVDKLTLKAEDLGEKNKLYENGKYLNALIDDLDNEIKTKREELLRSSGGIVVGAGKEDKKEKSDRTIRLEKELHMLFEQRDLARKNQINTFSTK